MGFLAVGAGGPGFKRRIQAKSLYEHSLPVTYFVYHRTIYYTTRRITLRIPKTGIYPSAALA